MTVEERRASLLRILAATQNVVQTVHEETRRAGELMDENEPQGSLLQLVRESPDLLDAVKLLPASLLACAAVVATETRSDGTTELRTRMEQLLRNTKQDGRARHMQQMLEILEACCADKPQATPNGPGTSRKIFHQASEWPETTSGSNGHDTAPSDE